MSEYVENDAILIRRHLGMPMPIGARVFGDAVEGFVWLDICMMGTHLPQMYRPEELERLTPTLADEMGLCIHCLGYGVSGQVGMVPLMSDTRVLEDADLLCHGCGGSGRQGIGVTIEQDEGGTTMSVVVQDHEVKLVDGVCGVCGLEPGSEWAQHVPSPGSK